MTPMPKVFKKCKLYICVQFKFIWMLFVHVANVLLFYLKIMELSGGCAGSRNRLARTIWAYFSQAGSQILVLFGFLCQKWPMSQT